MTRTSSRDQLARSSSPIQGEAARSGARLLVIDDRKLDREVLRGYLGALGYQISEAESAQAALEAIEKSRPDLILCDVIMPEMDGYQFLKILKRDKRLRHIPVIMISAIDETDSVVRGIELGADDYLVKPFNPLVLKARIGNCLEKKTLQDELRLRLVHLEQIHDQMPDAVFATLDRNFNVLEINDQAHEFLRVESGTGLEGLPIVEVLGYYAAEVAEAVQELLENRQSVRNLYISAPKDPNGERLLLLNLTDLISGSEEEGSSESAWVLTLRDVTPDRPLGGPRDRTSFHGIIGRDPAVMQIQELILRVAPFSTSVLILGPTGSGKELVAQAIHAESDRKARPLIAVNCSALAGELLESELFGHVRGAFTGAIDSRKGRFREADGGTLFLDEIGDTSESFQTSLLRVLETGEIQPVGQDRTVKVNVRILCATSKDLPVLIEQGKFREDLYYRINALPIKIPPLSERPGDLQLLIDAIRREFNHQFKKAIRFVSHDAMQTLAKHNWPGNVRELRHVLEHAFIVSSGPMITKADLPDTMLNVAEPLHRKGSSSLHAPIEHDPSSLDQMLDESHRIEYALGKSGGNVTRAAALLGMHRTTLRRRIKALGIEGRKSPRS